MPNAPWGFSLQAAYDSRKTNFNQIITPCNCPADLSTNLSYISVEPTVRFAPYNGNFYLFGGPRLAFNLDKSFTYQLGANPLYPDQVLTPAVTGDLSEVHKTLVSMQVGAGYDIPLSSQNHQIQTIFSPFVSFQPYFGQSPRAIETWNITTLRVGSSTQIWPRPQDYGAGSNGNGDHEHAESAFCHSFTQKHTRST